MHTVSHYSTSARLRPLSAAYHHRPSFSGRTGAGGLFAGTSAGRAAAATAATAGGDEGTLATRTNIDLDLDQDVQRMQYIYSHVMCV